MALSVEQTEAVRVSLSGVNAGVNIGSLTDTTVNGANTFATLRARVAAATGLSVERDQANKDKVLRGLDIGNIIGILTDANLNGLTTTAGVVALFTSSTTGDGRLPSTYTASAPQ